MIVNRLRRWARGHTREGRYSPVGVTFHWVVAALVLFQLWLGWRTGGLPVGAEKLRAYEVHSQTGLAILVLTLARMVWRLMVPGPVNDADKQGWRSTAAHLTHFAFYACLLGLPLSGWAMMSATASEQDLSVGGIAPWPPLPFEGLAPTVRWAIEAWAEQIHWAFVIAVSLLIPVHVGAALYHELLHRDDVLDGMLPSLGRAQRLMGRGWRHIRQALPPRKASGAG